LVLVFIISAMTELETHADWTDIGKVNGVQVYRDNDNNLEWTTPLNRAGTSQSARQQVANLGFRLPTHREFRSLEHNGGINRLGIPTGWGRDFFWESTGQIVNGNGGNFRSLLPPNYIRLVRDNWVIGVRKSGGQGEITSITSTTNNIRILFIYGTKDASPVYKKSLDVSKRKLQELINASEFTKSHVTTLEGDDASLENILSTTRQLCKKVGSNGAVMVYYLGHGGTVIKPNGKKIHCLFPFANPIEEETGFVVARSDIYSILADSNIRFTALITDACSDVIEEPEQEEKFSPAPPVRVRAKPITPLRRMLLYGRGNIDIGSSDPDKEGPEGEMGQRGFFTSVSGAFFTDAFTNRFGKLEFTNKKFSENDFEEQLQEVQRHVNQAITTSQSEEVKLQGSQNIKVFHSTLR
jgi:hypothetical protein